MYSMSLSSPEVEGHGRHQVPVGSTIPSAHSYSCLALDAASTAQASEDTAAQRSSRCALAQLYGTQPVSGP